MRKVTWFLVGVLAIAVLVYTTGCASSGLYDMSDQWCDAHPEASPARCKRDHTQSWDQETLKRHDTGSCPTAIYTAPGGTLEQC